MWKERGYELFSLEGLGNWLKRVKVKRSIELIQNHHTYIPNYAHFLGNNHQELLYGMECAHLRRGFDGIAQNFTTFPDGAVALCRSLEKDPAGIRGANRGGICIEHLGNFDAGRDTMSEAQKRTIIDLNALLCFQFGLSPSPKTLVYHHWYDRRTGERTGGSGSTKSCPGTGFFGGNTIEAAGTNFIPLIAKALALLTRRDGGL